MRFVETPVFTGLVCKRLDDDDYRALQITLLLRPEQGAVIPGSAGLRKIRWGAEATCPLPRPGLWLGWSVRSFDEA